MTASPRVAVKWRLNMKRSFFNIPILLFALCLTLTACGPSDEKITEAQQKFTELTQIHNTAVEARKAISDSSLDAVLSELQGKIDTVKTYNLQEMNDEEIDLLIQTMGSLIGSYEKYLAMMEEIKNAEEAAVLTPIPVTLINNTGISFTSLSLYEEGSAGIHPDVLESLSAFSPGQCLTGLMIQRDSENTPWIMTLTKEDETVLEYSFPVEEYSEKGITVSLSLDSETETLAPEITE